MIEAAVVDASVAIKWVIGEAGAEAAAKLAGSQLSAPDILLAECGSALWAKARRGEITDDEALSALAALRRAPVVLTPVPVLAADALRLALLIGHPIYDCLYLALSLQTQGADGHRRSSLRRPRLPGSSELAGRVVLLDQSGSRRAR